MKKKFFMFGAGNILLLLAVLFGALSAGSLIASAHSVQNTSNTISAATATPDCQQYLRELAKRLNLPVATLEQESQGAKYDTLPNRPACP
jgi:hypothetical protein